MAHDAPALPSGNHAGFTKGELATLIIVQGMLAGGAEARNVDGIVSEATALVDAVLRAAAQRR